MNAAINLYKPSGITSQRAVSIVKRLTGAKKAGHTGTLDPLAEGVLPILLEKATKAQDMILNADKRYIARFRLGITTDTQDITGTVLSERPVMAKLADVEKAVSGFVGKIRQVPPMYSAIKKDGQKLYKLARAGIEIEREPREIEIFSADIVSADEVINEYCIDVHCSKGTYIRTLCADIGEALGCGATMTYLCRSKTGMFDRENSITLDELQKLADDGHIENALISVDQLFEHLPAINLTKRQERLLTNGVRLEAAVEKFPVSEGCEYRLYGAGGFLGIARAACVDGVLFTVMTANFKEV